MIFVKEIYPNPSGSDTGMEWIKLSNNSPENTRLNKWVIKDASGKSYILGDISIAGYSDLILKNSETKILLGNKGDSVLLYDSAGHQVDGFIYKTDVRDGGIVSRDGVVRFQMNEDLIENNLPPVEAMIAKTLSPSFLGTALIVGIVFACMALFVVRKLSEE